LTRGKLPPTPDFAAIEREAQKYADRKTMILALIGNLIFSWSNNESMFIYVLMVLLETDEATAAVVFVTLNTTRARLDLILRLAALKVADPAVARTLNGLIRQFNNLTRLRNEFNHCMYVLNEHGEITHIRAMRLEEDKHGLSFGATQEMNDARVEQIIDAVRRLTKLNREIWEFLPRLRDGIAAS
jgi:hypothetical protein